MMDNEEIIEEDLDNIEDQYIDEENQNNYNEGYNRGQRIYNDVSKLKKLNDNKDSVHHDNLRSGENVNDLARQERLKSLKNNKIDSNVTNKLGNISNAVGTINELKNAASTSSDENIEDGAEKTKEAIEGVAEYGVKEGVSVAVQAAIDASTAGIGAAPAKIIGDTVGSIVAKPIVKIIGIILGILLIMLLLIISIFICLDIDYDNDDNISDVSQNSEISLTRTDLSKEEFVAACDKQTSHRDFYSKCGTIYDLSIQKHFNPEMVVIRAYVEGFSPGSSNNNYWGLGCYNTGGGCLSYGSFSDGVLAFIKNVSQYESVEQMMSKYAYIGKYWYNPGGSGMGGCYYYPYIKEYMSLNRSAIVGGYCSSRPCSGSMCQPSNDEDQLAYSKWQVANMAKTGVQIFGRVTSDTASKDAVSTNPPNSVADLKNRYYFTFDIDKYLDYEKKNNHLFGQCVWYSYHRGMDIINSSNLSEEEKNNRISNLGQTSGDGGVYASNMNSTFKKTTNIDQIKAPAIISWANGSYGHVAIIEKITVGKDGKKTYYITEGWRTRDCSNRTWCTHNSLDQLWNVTNFNSTTLSSVATYNNGTFVAAASLLE